MTPLFACALLSLFVLVQGLPDVDDVFTELVRKVQAQPDKRVGARDSMRHVFLPEFSCDLWLHEDEHYSENRQVLWLHFNCGHFRGAPKYDLRRFVGLRRHNPIRFSGHAISFRDFGLNGQNGFHADYVFEEMWHLAPDLLEYFLTYRYASLNG